MIVPSTFALFLICVLYLQTLNAIHPAYFRDRELEERMSSIMDSIHKQLDDQRTNSDSSEISEDDDQLVKRNKYPNFHVSPLWLSRRTRTNRMYGKPLWISRPG